MLERVAVLDPMNLILRLVRERRLGAYMLERVASPPALTYGPRHPEFRGLSKLLNMALDTLNLGDLVNYSFKDALSPGFSNLKIAYNFGTKGRRPL